MISSWKYFIPASAFLSIGIFTWYDAVSRIGASKESLLSGTIETVAIIFLARIFLRERLAKIQMVGIAITLSGFVLVIMSDSSLNNNNNNLLTPILSIFDINTPLTIKFGDIEAIFSALSFAVAVFFLTKLMSKHSPLEVAGICLLLSGLFLIVIMFLLSPEISISIFIDNWYIFTLFSLLPLLGTICYVEGLRRIGASLTATIGSSRILLTLLIQIILTQFGISNVLPDNILLALSGGILGIFGIILIHKIYPLKLI